MDNQVNISKKQDTVKALQPKVQQLQEGKIMQGSTKKFESFIEKKEHLCKFLALQISQSQNLEEIFNNTVTELRQLLKNERVIIYNFKSDVGGKVVAESVIEPLLSILGTTVLDPYFEENLVADYQQGRIQSFGDLETAGLTPCHSEILANLQVKANLVVPILLENNQFLETGKKQNYFSPYLWGLLVAQNCSSHRNWQPDEIELLKQLSTYLSLAIRQNLFEKKLAAEQSEKRRLEIELKAVKKKLEVKQSNHTSKSAIVENCFLNHDEKQLHFLIDGVRDYGIFMLNSKGDIISWNPGAEKITGYTETDILGKNFSQFFCEADIKQGKLQQVLERAIQTGRYEGKELIVRQDGRKICCSTIITALDDQFPKTYGFTVVMRDITAKQEQEIRLKLLEKAIFSSSNGIIITDATQPNNPIIYVNPSFEKITGYEAEEVIGRNPGFLPNETTQKSALECLQTGTYCDITQKNYRKDHTVFWHELTIDPIKDEQGKLTHYVGVQKDITEKVEAENERDRFFSLSMDMLCIANFEGYFVKLNPGWEKTLGYTQEELLSQPFLNFVHPEDRESTQAELEQVFQGSSAINFENRYRCKDGSYRWLMWNSTPLTELGKIYAVARDITERKEVEQALKTSQERFRTVADFTYDWEYWLNPERKLIYVSPSCERITGYTPEEFLENPNLFKTIVHPKDWEMVQQYFADSFETNPTYSMDFRIITRGGETKWIGHRCQTVYSQDQRWLGRRVSNRDITDYKQMEISLRDSEERFRSIFSQAEVGIIQATATGELLLFNEKFVELVKYSQEELLHKKLADIIHREDFPTYTEQVKQLWAGKIEAFSLDQRYICKDGLTVWINISVSIIRNVAGKAKCYMGMIQDINERKQTEQRLQENQYLFNHAERLAHLGSWQYDLLTEKVTGSDELFRIFSLPPESGFTYQEMLQWYYPEDAKYQEKLLRQAIQEGKPYSLEAQIISRNGKTRDIFALGQPVLNEQGEVIKLFGTVQDITNRKRAELALRESEERFRLMADGAPVLIWVSGIDGKYNYFNQVWLKFTGRTLEEELGDGWLKGVHPEDLDYCLKTYMNAFYSRENFRREYRLCRSDGEYRWVLDRAVPRFTANGEFTGYIGCCLDITESKQNQEQLQLWVNELELRHQEMVMLGKMNEFLQVCTSVEEAEKMLGDLLKPLFPNCCGSIFRMITEENLLVMVASWGKCVSNVPIFEPSQCWALRRGSIHLVEADSSSLLCQHINATIPPAKSLCIPMMVNGDTVGLIQLSAMKPEPLSEAKQQLGCTVAQHLALALANLELRETLKNQSIRDGLTGLYNRRYLEEFLEQEIHRAKRNENSVGVIMIDIDHFKRFNDNFGHDAGDLVLQEVGKTLMNAVRKSDVACRYGGEELTLILPGASIEETQKRAEEIRLAIKQLRLRHRETTLDFITASFGVACYPQHGRTSDKVIQTADAALYRAKEQGRDRTVVSG
ncbi:PAS domain S-box protein [Dapis sp. BLCC M172]|uniref:PAS domain S-box protein n=1 Tax=Dapis sp. BLCC M172 TaxID=2975281 RepID=UPI003CEA14EF